MKQILFIPLLLAVLAGNQGFAQTKSKKPLAAHAEILNNGAIINLAKAGLGNDVIIAKIAQSKTNFDLSSSGLIALKNQNIDNDVIKAMMAKSGNLAENPATTAKPDAVVRASAATIPDIATINHVCQFSKTSGKVTPLEKVTANLKFKKKFMGYGGMDVMYTVTGPKSPMRLSSDDAQSFVMNTGGAAPDMTLYRLTVTKDGRQAITQKLKAMASNMVTDDNMVAFTMQSVKTGIFQFVPAAPLQKGEYFFVAKNLASATTMDAFAFGID